MVESRAAERYAKSLLDLAVEQKSEDAVYSDTLLLVETIKESRDLQLLLKSPIIHHSDKSKVLDKIFGKKINKLTKSFLELITKNGREVLTYDIFKSCIVQYDKLKGIQKAVVTTTYKITDSQREEFANLVKSITGKTPEIIEESDKDIIGGFILNIGDREIDASVRSKLKKIEFELTN